MNLKHPSALSWRNHFAFRGQPFPIMLRPWITDTGSLTQKLRQASAGQFELCLLNSQWQTPKPDERHALSLPERQTALVREVLLKGKNQPWIYARSIIPRTSFIGPLQSFKHGSHQPLGEILFNHPKIIRRPAQFAHGSLAQLTSTDLSYHHCNMENSVWARRSVFDLDNALLLVMEVFLPDLPEYPRIGVSFR